MPTFLFTYKGARNPDNPEEGQKLMARWNAWVEEHRDRIAIPSTPLGPAKTVDSKGVDDLTEAVKTNGFTALTADSLEEAVGLARSCPHTEIGQIEVREMFAMPGAKS